MVLISALLGCAAIVWAQFAFKCRVGSASSSKTTRSASADQRTNLVAGFVAGMALGGAVVGGGAAQKLKVGEVIRSWGDRRAMGVVSVPADCRILLIASARFRRTVTRRC